MYAPERQYISRYANDIIGLSIYSQGILTDATNNQVQVTFINEDTETTVFQRAADHVSTGMYQTQLNGDETAQPGLYRIRWDYALSARATVFDTYVQIGESSPTYDRLAPGMKEVVDQVWIRFADLFDSPHGGPHLATYFQSNFGRDRIAQLLRVAVGRLNTVAQPHNTYSIDGDGGAAFPVLSWGPLAEQALYVEVIKHLRRSYVEQPDLRGTEVTRLDRRDYLDRWGMILEGEEEDLRQRLGTFKISQMGLGRPSVLVGGGVYGRYSPTRYAGSAAARGRFWARFFTVILVAGAGFGALGHVVAPSEDPEQTSTSQVL